MIQHLKMLRFLILIIAGILNISLSNSQWIPPDSKFNNLETEFKLGFIDTSGNIILPANYIFLAKIDGCNKILAQEYVQNEEYYLENNGDYSGTYYLADINGQLEKLPVNEIVYHGYDWFIARKDSLWGIIDCKKNWILDPIFDHPLAAIGDYLFIYRDSLTKQENYWGDNFETLLEGMINMSGDTIIPPDYIEIHPLDWWDKPYIIVEESVGRCGLLEMDGDVVIPVGDYYIFPSIMDESVWIIENDITRVYYPASGKWITEDPEKLTTGLYGFESGLKLEVNRDWYDLPYWVDKDRTIRIAGYPENIKKSFEQPWLSYLSRDGYYGIVSKKGDTILPFIFEEILLDKDQYYWDPEFSCISEGIATVRLNYNWALVDTSGKFLTHLFYSELGRVTEGMAPAEMNGRWGYIDRNGKEIVPFIYNYASPVKNGLGKVYIIESPGWINTYGRLVYKTWTEEDALLESDNRAISPVAYDLDYIMEDYETFEEVDYLDLDLSHYTSFPEEFYRFTNTIELYIYGYKLPCFHFQPGKFENLQWLSISGSDLESIPGGISQFTKLDMLEIMGCKLHSLPAHLFSHPNLNYVSLEGNQIEFLPKEIPVQKKLVTLSLMGNNIKAIPSSIANLRKLDDLNLDHNLITSLPPEMGRIKKLQYLDLTSNQLTGLPPEMANLKKLKMLFLSDNQLNEIPLWISELKSLHSLYLEDNNIERVPDEVINMKNLSSLGLKGNPIPEAEKERIIKMRPDLDMFE